MTLISIGTGNPKPGRGEKVLLGLLSQAREVPNSLIGAFQRNQDMLCRVHGQCRFGDPIDSELGDMRRSCGQSDFVYARYDKVFSAEDVAAAERATTKGFTLDNLELMDFLCDRGSQHALEVVDLAHLGDE